jgi:integrase
MARLAQYVQRRGSGIFHLRIAVPEDIRPYLKRIEIRQSLNTRDAGIALALAHQLRNTISSVFEECRAMKKRQTEPKLHHFSYTVTLPDGAVHSIEIERENPEEEALISARAISALNEITPKPVPQAVAAPDRLSKVIGEYVAERVRENAWTAKTKLEAQGTFNLLVSILGDSPIAQIDAASARLVKELLQKTPPNLNKSPAFRGKTFQEVIAMSSPKVISIPTFNKHISTLGGLFAWAKRQRYVNENPFEGMALKAKSLPHEKRSVFLDEDLKKLFGSAVFTEKKFLHPYCYWLPLLGLYSGARIEELCQLHLADIRQIDGIWVFDINSDDEKNLKNLSSKRIVPIHEKLIGLGFLDYVEKLRIRKANRLFPELKKQRDGYSQAAQKWFNARYKKGCGVIDSKKTFHSFLNRPGFRGGSNT